MGRVELVSAGDSGDPAIYRVAPRPAGAVRRSQAHHFTLGPRLIGLVFRGEGRGRFFHRLPETSMGEDWRQTIRDPRGGAVVAVASVVRRPGGNGRTRKKLRVETDWRVSSVFRHPPATITPRADVAEGTGPAASGETLRDEEVAVFEANNFTSKVESGPIERGAWKVMGWVWPAILAAAVVAVLAWAAGARGDEPRQWTRPYLVVPTCPGGRCSQQQPVAAVYPSPSSPAPAVYRAPAARPGVVYYQTRCRFGRCGR
jgi:hypothetical protein